VPQRRQEVLRVWHDVLREPNLRRVLLAFIGFNVAEYATWIAIMVFAYHVGGVAASGLAGAIQLVPAAAIAPVASVLGDHYRRDRLLLAGYVLQAGTAALAGIALINRPPLPLVLLVAALAASAVTLTRPVQGALLPDIAEHVEGLTAANVMAAWIEGLSIFAGPLLTGVLLAVVTPGIVFLLMAGVLVVSALLAARVSVPPIGTARGTLSIGRELSAGLRYLGSRPTPRTIVSFLSAHFFLVGSVDVLFVILAFRLLHAGNSGVGFVNAAFGLGGLVAAVAMAITVGQRRLLRALALGTAAWTVGLACVAVRIGPAAAVLFMGLAGAGRPLIDAAGRTMLQRAVDEPMLTRTFGLVEGLSMGAQAAGMASVPLLALTLGDRSAFVVLAALLPILLLLLWRPLSSGEIRAPAPDRLAAIRHVPFFAPLSMLTVERLALSLISTDVAPGSVIVAEGEPGDRFYVIRQGNARVSIAGREVRMLEACHFFGEIALLRDVPRTASVTAVTDLSLYALEREDFLQALWGNLHSRQAAEAVADTHLARQVSPPA
jgi:MFS family permease